MSKKIYILRHALAEDHREEEYDVSRNLVPAGERQLLRVSKFMMENGIHVDGIYSSELNRARQSAEIVRIALNLKKVEVCSWLNIYSDTDLAVREILSLSIGQVPLIVGHNPDLATVVSKILGAPDEIIRVKKAGLLCLVEKKNGQGFRLDFSIPENLLSA